MTMTFCRTCETTKPTTEFIKSRLTKDKSRGSCKSCENAKSSQWRKNNPDKVRALAADWRARNKDKVEGYQSKWRDNNRQYARDKSREWLKNNSEKNVAKVNERRAIKKQRALWGSVDYYYEQARYLTELTGIQFVVDHIIPLKHDKVSGLHVPENLSIITKAENDRKKNKFTV